MQVVRSFVWVVLAAILIAFIAMNWEAAPINVWPLENGYLHFEWPVGIIALIFFLLGLVPMWLIHKGARWRFKRRISSLENTVRATTTTPIATSTQLEASSGREESQIG